MDNSIKIMLGIKDPHLELEQKNFADLVEYQDDRIIVHLVQSYPMTCPKLMLKNDVRESYYRGPALN